MLLTVTVNLSSSEALKATLNIYRLKEIKFNRLNSPGQILKHKFQCVLFLLNVSSPMYRDIVSTILCFLLNQAFQQNMNWQAISVLYYQINQEETGRKQTF